MEYIVKILEIEQLTHDIKRFVVEKPKNVEFIPGQATSIAINTKDLRKKKRPFTFTSLNEDPSLEFIIKEYPDHNGITQELHKLKVGDELIVEDPWGTIKYDDKGIFIAGGAGVTPFIAILRQLCKEDKISGNKVFFSNKTSKDVILEDELREKIPEENLILTLTKEKHPDYHYGRIDEKFIRENVTDFSQNFYICGPKQMIVDIKNILVSLGASSQEIVFER
ncbi:FAD-binding oxidoreductase [Patescibacteria group bacterium]